MAITIELTPEQEASVAAIANERGMSVQQVVGQLLAAQLSVTLSDATLPPGAHPPASSAMHPVIDNEQRRLHAILQELFAHSDALEGRPSDPLTESSKASIYESIREKYRAQGLLV